MALRCFLFLCCLFLLAACASPRDLDHAPAGDQRIVFWHKPSNEHVDVTYRSGGRYSASAMDQIDHIFRDRHNGDVYPIDPALIDVVADLRDRMVMPADTPIELLSGYRSPGTNAELAKTNRFVARGSYHIKGMAVDIRIPDMNTKVLEAVAKTMQRGGVAYYPMNNHVHVDTGPVRGWAVIGGQEAELHRSRQAPARSGVLMSETEEGDKMPVHAGKGVARVVETQPDGALAETARLIQKSPAKAIKKASANPQAKSTASQKSKTHKKAALSAIKNSKGKTRKKRAKPPAKAARTVAPTPPAPQVSPVQPQ